MKELLKKKSVKIVLLLIVLLVVMGIVGMNASSAQRRKDYNGHVDAAEKYLAELDYEQAIAEYTLALEIEPNSKEILDELEETYLAYAQTYADMEEYESAIEILERGYEQIGRESLREKIEELRTIQAQKEEEEKERLLAEEAEKQRLLEEEAEKQRLLEEEAEKQRLLAEAQEQEAAEDEEEEIEEMPAPKQKPEEVSQAEGESDKLAVYQAKAADYAFSIQREFYENSSSDIDGYASFVDARSLKTQVEFCEYFHRDPMADFQGKRGSVVGAVNTSLLEETESQYKILVSDIVFYTFVDSPFGDITYFEFVIDKATGQGTITDSYFDEVYVSPEEPYSSMLELTGRFMIDDYGCKGRVFDFN